MAWDGKNVVASGHEDLSGGPNVDTTPGICQEIREARCVGSTRCGIIDQQLSIIETARAFALADDITIYRFIEKQEADAIAIQLLHVDLAYGTTIMSLGRARELWQRFLTLFDRQLASYATNTNSVLTSWMPATKATFDMGVLVLGTTRIGCLWIEDED
jgi:hypothetical protein